MKNNIIIEITIPKNRKNYILDGHIDLNSIFGQHDQQNVGNVGFSIQANISNDVKRDKYSRNKVVHTRYSLKPYMLHANFVTVDENFGQSG